MKYDINIDTGYSTGGGFYSLEWTTEKPTQVGYYWAMWKNGFIGMVKWYSLDIVSPSDLDIPEFPTNWLGPLPVPVSPAD